MRPALRPHYTWGQAIHSRPKNKCEGATRVDKAEPSQRGMRSACRAHQTCYDLWMRRQRSPHQKGRERRHHVVAAGQGNQIQDAITVKPEQVHAATDCKTY